MHLQLLEKAAADQAVRLTALTSDPVPTGSVNQARTPIIVVQGGSSGRTAKTQPRGLLLCRLSTAPHCKHRACMSF